MVLNAKKKRKKEDERQAMKTRFKNEGLDDSMPDEKKLAHVWRWMVDAETNWISMKKQNEKLYKQQEEDLKELEEYIESLWKQSSNRLLELQTENQLLKQEIYNLKLSKPTDYLDIVNNNRRNLVLNNKQTNENCEIIPVNMPNDQQKENNKKSTFSNVKQMFIKNTSKEQNDKQSNLENELRFMIDKCRSIETEKKRLETENENLVFKLNETLAICDRLESSKANVQMARNSKSYYELRQATSEYGLNKNKLITSKTMNFQTIHQDELNDNKSTSGVDSSSSQDKENEPIKTENGQLKINSTKKISSNINLDSGRESTSTLADSRESKDFTKDLLNSKNAKEYYEEAESVFRLMNAIKDECAILKNELIAKEKQIIAQEKQLSELQLKYEKRKARHKDQILKLKTHIERETKRWEKLFNEAKQKTVESDKNEHLVDSL